MASGTLVINYRCMPGHSSANAAALAAAHLSPSPRTAAALRHTTLPARTDTAHLIA